MEVGTKEGTKGMIYTTNATWRSAPSGTLTAEGLLADLRRMRRELDLTSPTGPVRIVSSPYYPRREIGASLPYMPPITRQPRSKRLWKKLCKRRWRLSRPITEPEDPVMIAGVLHCSVEHERALREHATPTNQLRSKRWIS